MWLDQTKKITSVRINNSGNAGCIDNIITAVVQMKSNDTQKRTNYVGSKLDKNQDKTSKIGSKCTSGNDNSKGGSE